MSNNSRHPEAEDLLHTGFFRWAETAPDRPALEVAADRLAYGELRDRALAIAATLQQRTPPGGPPLTAVFAHRSATAFAGILGALCAGRGYVPLNRTFPPGRTRRMLEKADSRSVVVDEGSLPQLDSILDGITAPLLVITPDTAQTAKLAERWPAHTFVPSSEMESIRSWSPQGGSPADIAYLLFTSGTTGSPKGVAVTHSNAGHFVKVIRGRHAPASDDRFSQMFDTTFDLSVFDMFVAWSSGACLCCPTGSALLNPDNFIRDKRLTVWASVPSVALFMNRFGVLKEGRYPSLRWSVFCGEPLPEELARQWARAAPGSIVDNLYGPTELTVACSAYRWHEGGARPELGIVPIGEPLPGLEGIVVDNDGREVAPGEIGELLMCGPQVTPGYWRDEQATRRSYVCLPGRRDIFYRTGDHVRRPVAGGPLTYIGRLDHQIKVLGHRVELGEVESKLREEPGVDAAVALGWPPTPAGAGGVAAFLTGQNLEIAAIRASIKNKLPPYAVPHVIRILPELPYSPNGKIDRDALRRVLET